MKKLKMARSVTLTFEEGCNKYLENCRQRNLREGTIIDCRCFAHSIGGDLRIDPLATIGVRPL